MTVSTGYCCEVCTTHRCRFPPRHPLYASGCPQLWTGGTVWWVIRGRRLSSSLVAFSDLLRRQRAPEIRSQLGSRHQRGPGPKLWQRSVHGMNGCHFSAQHSDTHALGTHARGSPKAKILTIKGEIFSKMRNNPTHPFPNAELLKWIEQQMGNKK